jgi:SAM-dependent methyltransferase
MTQHGDILKDVNDYYTGKVRQHGATPQGVDWNGEESQHLRFKTLLRVVDEPDRPFSMLDYGCGYGSMYDYMKDRFANFQYTGFDISEAMIVEAKKQHGAAANWTTERDGSHHDFIVASGIFNVRLKNDDAGWREYVHAELDWMNGHAAKGFAFNMLTSYSDADKMRDYLFYADPTAVFDRCKRKYSKFVALLHDYPLYEFTILVRKDA